MWNEACDVVDLSVGEEIKSTKPTYEELEKALDVACEKLVEKEIEIDELMYGMDFPWHTDKTKNEWKEWCLNNVNR